MAGMKWPAIGLIFQRLRWESDRWIQAWVRRFGRPGLFAVVCLLISLAAGLFAQQQVQALNQLRHTHAHARSVKMLTPVLTDNVKKETSVTRLQAFDAYLLAHDEIPDTLKNVFALAEEMHLILARGEYKAQIETQGGFLRYGMALPVKGDAQAIHTFILTALAKNQTLALENIQFKRERIESNEIEARIQWVLFTRLPTNAKTPVDVIERAENTEKSAKPTASSGRFE